MTLAETLKTALVQQVSSSYTFAFDPAADQWTVNGKVSIKSPEDQVDLDRQFTWTFANRQLTSHIPKIKLEEAMTEWGLNGHPKAKAFFDLLDMQFRNERGKIIDQVFQVYKPGEPTNF